jgi:hypothetical protein
MWDDYRFGDKSEGISFLVKFIGVDYQVPLCELIP